MILDKLTGQLDTPKALEASSLFLSVFQSFYCITASRGQNLKGCFTGVNFQIVTSKGLRKNYCLVFRYFEAEEGQVTVTRKFSLICHSSAKWLALMLKGC